MATIVERLLAIRRYTDRLHGSPGSDGVRSCNPGACQQASARRDDRPCDVRPGDRGDDDLSRRVRHDGGSPRFTVREVDTELLVVADLRGVVRDDQQTEIDLGEDALVLTVDNRFAWRVPVADGQSSITAVSLNNDILEARVHVGD